jgi:hypothetical protein
MIDFRYHLISLIAVILALALGIIVGSGFLGGPLLDRLESDVDDLSKENAQRLERIDELESSVAQGDAFARIVGDYLLDETLAGVKVVVFQFEESDGQVVGNIKREIEAAGGQISAEITLSEKFELGTQPTADELALALGSVEMKPEELRIEAATVLGERSAAAAVETVGSDSPTGAAAERFNETVNSLERSEFVGVRAEDDGRTIPQGASFVVIGGDDDAAGYEPSGFAVALVEALGDRGAPTVVVEPFRSTWALVTSIRQDVEARGAASTIDNGETTIGQIGTVLALAQAQGGEIGHFGFGAGRTGPIPPPPAP